MRLYEKVMNQLFEERSQSRGKNLPTTGLDFIYDYLSGSKLFLVDCGNLQEIVKKEFDGKIVRLEETATPFNKMFFEFTPPVHVAEVGGLPDVFFAIHSAVSNTIDDTVSTTSYHICVYIKDCIWEKGSSKTNVDDRIGYLEFDTAPLMCSMTEPCPNYSSCTLRKKRMTEEEAYAFVRKDQDGFYIEDTDRGVCELICSPTILNRERFNCQRLRWMSLAREMFYNLLIVLNSPATIKTLHEYEPGFVVMQSGEKKRKPLPNPYYELRLSRGTQSDEKLMKHKAGWNISYCFDVRSHIRRYVKYRKTAVVKAHKRGLKFANSTYIPKTYVIEGARATAVPVRLGLISSGVALAKRVYRFIGRFI